MLLHKINVQPRQQGGSYACFSALTASSQLTALILAGSGNGNRPVPQEAFQHMFPPGQVLPQLKQLSLHGHPGLPCVEAAQVAMIAASCPALQKLTLQFVTPVGFDVSCLAQLPPSVTEVKGLGWTRPVP
jgi:hypothetical protein